MTYVLFPVYIFDLRTIFQLIFDWSNIQVRKNLQRRKLKLRNYYKMLIFVPEKIVNAIT